MLTYEKHGPLIRDILVEEGRALPIMALVQKLALKGAVDLKVNTDAHLYPSHPLRKQVSEIVTKLYQNGELAAMDRPKSAVEAARYVRVWEQ